MPKLWPENISAGCRHYYLNQKIEDAENMALTQTCRNHLLNPKVQDAKTMTLTQKYRMSKPCPKHIDTECTQRSQKKHTDDWLINFSFKKNPKFVKYVWWTNLSERFKWFNTVLVISALHLIGWRCWTPGKILGKVAVVYAILVLYWTAGKTSRTIVPPLKTIVSDNLNELTRCFYSI
jgi:hypothetical protein